MEAPTEAEKKPRRRVKKVKGHGGHHGGAWKVAYADFVTAMMALFLVLWLVSQADIKVKQAIASYFRSPGVFNSMDGGILPQSKKVSREPGALSANDDEQALISAAQTLKKQFSTRPEFSRYKEQVQIDVTEDGLRIQIIDKADRVSFPSGSAKLAGEAEQILAEIAEGICSLPNKINIGGHTDSRVFPSDNGYTNWELSADRANAARRILEAGCVKTDQIRRIVGFADTELMVPSDPYSPANRRISITVLRLAPTEENSKSKEDSDVSTEKEARKNLSPKTIEKEAEKKPSPKTKISANQSVPDEQQKAKDKLQTEGAVTIGEPDEIPGKPKSK